MWTERLSSPTGTRTRLAEVGGDGLAGFVHLRFDDEPAWGCLIDNLHVRHDLQRQGIATRLMRDAAALVVAETPGRPMHLWVLEQNTRARAFYRAMGGQEADRRAVAPPARPGVDGIRVVWPDPAVLAEGG